MACTGATESEPGQAGQPSQLPDEQLSDASAPGSGVAVLEKLAALDMSRKAEREKRKGELIEAADPRESIQQFLVQFNGRLQAMDSELQARLSSHGQADTSGQGTEGAAAAAGATKALDQLSAQAFELERSVAEASYFLPLYDQKQSIANISDFKTRVEDARAVLVPKRKFAFSKKVARVKAEEASASAPAPAGQPTSASTEQCHGGHGGAHPAASTSYGAPQGDACSSAPDSDAVVAVITERDRALIRTGRGFAGLRGQTLVCWAHEIASQDFVLVDLADCTVFLLGHMPALRMLGLRRTRVYSGPVTGACFMDDVQGCTLAVASYQVGSAVVGWPPATACSAAAC